MERFDFTPKGLYEAVLWNKYKRVREIVESKKVDVNSTHKQFYNDDALSPLCVAVKVCDPKMINLLIKLGADHSQRTQNTGQTPVFYLFSSGFPVGKDYYGTMKTLLKKGFDPNVLDARGRTLINHAMSRPEISVVGTVIAILSFGAVNITTVRSTLKYCIDNMKLEDVTCYSLSALALLAVYNDKDSSVSADQYRSKLRNHAFINQHAELFDLYCHTFDKLFEKVSISEMMDVLVEASWKVKRTGYSGGQNRYDMSNDSHMYDIISTLNIVVGAELDQNKYDTESDSFYFGGGGGIIVGKKRNIDESDSKKIGGLGVEKLSSQLGICDFYDKHKSILLMIQQEV